jgi:hypothetical protein
MSVDPGDDIFSRKDPPAPRPIPRLRLITWRPPGLPFRGVALLAGPLNWEVEINQDSGQIETAVIGLSTPGAAWHYDLLGRRLSKCSGRRV